MNGIWCPQGDSSVLEKSIRDISPTGKLVEMDSLAEIFYDLAKPNWDVANGSVIQVNGGIYV